MTPLEAAQAIAETDNLRHDTIDDVPHCNFCGRDYQHAPECPWRQMPQIVKALEAASEVAFHVLYGRNCYFCMEVEPSHTAKCKMALLRGTLVGEDYDTT